MHHLLKQAATHRKRFGLLGEDADLDQAIGLLRAACQETGMLEDPRPYLDLGAVLIEAYDSGRDASLLDEAVQVLRMLLPHEPASRSLRTQLRNNLASALYKRFESTGNSPDLDDAVALYRSAARIQHDPAGRALYLANLGGVLAARYQREGADNDLTESLEALRESLANTPESSDMRAERLDSYGVALQISFQKTGDLASLEESVSVLREAARLAGASPAAAPPLRNLAGGLEARFDVLGRPQDLDDAIGIYRKITASVPETDHDLPMYLQDAGNALGRRYAETGNIGDLDEGIELLRRALSIMPATEAERCIALHALGVSLDDRFERHGARADLDEAEELLRAAVDATPAGHAYRPVHLGSLARCLQDRFELEHDRKSIDEAVRLHELTAETELTGVSRATALSNLGGALLVRYQRWGAPSDLRRAIAAHEDSIAVAGPGYPNLCLYRANLGEALTISARDTRQAGHADAAVAVLTTAADEAGSGHLHHIAILVFLARAFAVRAGLSGVEDDQQRALEAWRAAAQNPTAPPTRRLTAAAEWADYAGQEADTTEALAACSTAIRMLPLVAWRGLRRQDQERLIAETSNVTADAIAWSLTAGYPVQAAELSEAGRSVLWSQMLDTRSDLTALHAAHPAVAERLDDIRQGLQHDDSGDC